MEWLNQFPIVVQVITYVVALNIFLTGLKSALDRVKNLTKNTVDNKVADFLGKVLSVMSKALDYVSANKEHK